MVIIYHSRITVHSKFQISILQSTKCDNWLVFQNQVDTIITIWKIILIITINDK